MGKFLDRTGLKYGRLTVMSHNGRDHRNKHLWLCKCECGNEKVVISDNLSSGKSNSCGCLKKEFLANSGTTGVACVNINRKFIGIELDEGYYKIASERIHKVLSEKENI